jgi:hypothetical protein
MTRPLALVPAAAGVDACPRCRAMADVLRPILELGAPAQGDDAQLVDVAGVLPPKDRRHVYRACRTGAIANAAKLGRRWLARRSDVDAWLRTLGPRLVVPASTEDEDKVDRAIRRLAAPGRRRRRAG